MPAAAAAVFSCATTPKSEDNTNGIVIKDNADNITITNNIFIGDDVQNAGVIVYGGKRIRINHNTFDRCAAPLRASDGTSGTFRNNIVRQGQMYIAGASRWEADHNAWRYVQDRLRGDGTWLTLIWRSTKP